MCIQVVVFLYVLCFFFQQRLSNRYEYIRSPLGACTLTPLARWRTLRDMKTLFLLFSDCTSSAEACALVLSDVAVVARNLVPRSSWFWLCDLIFRTACRIQLWTRGGRRISPKKDAFQNFKLKKKKCRIKCGVCEQKRTVLKKNK